MSIVRDRAAILVWAGAMVVAAIMLGVRDGHDYTQYLDQWSLVRSGQDPWSSTNTYGPLHNVLAYLLVFGDTGPKIFMVLAYVAVAVVLGFTLLATRPASGTRVLAALIVPLNVLVVGAVANDGLNDTLAAAFVGLAVWARFKERMVLVGVLLGLAILLKYYPALMLPFFCLDRRRVVLRPLLAAAATTAVGLLLTWIVWGSAFLRALQVGADRPPKVLSVLAALDSTSPVVAFLSAHNAAFVLAGAAVALATSWALRWSWIEGATVGTLLCLLLYKVGHQQFLLPWLFLLLGLLILGTARTMVWACLPFVVFQEVFHFGSNLYGPWWFSSHFASPDWSFVAFGLGVATLVACLLLRKDPHVSD